MKEIQGCFFPRNPRGSRQVSRKKQISLSAAAGVRAARPKTPRRLLAATCSGPGVFVMDRSRSMRHFRISRAAGESGGARSPGRWRLQLVPRPNPYPPPRRRCVRSGRTTVPLQVPTQAEFLAATARPPAGCPLKGAVCGGYSVFFKALGI